jgi:hypothetical protein
MTLLHLLGVGLRADPNFNNVNHQEYLVPSIPAQGLYIWVGLNISHPMWVVGGMS